MTDASDFAAVQGLQMQIDSLNKAVAILQDNGRITYMTISSEQHAEPAQFLQIDTAFMTTPPQMIDAIIAQMQQQIDILQSQLSGMVADVMSRTTPRTASRKR